MRGSGKLGSGKKKQDTLTNLIAVFQDTALDFIRNRADVDIGSLHLHYSLVSARQNCCCL